MRSLVLAGLCLAVFCTAPTARAGVVIYNTGFEGLTIGSVVGQAGWIQDIGNAAAFQVQSSVVKSGTQALQANPTGEPDFSRIYQFVTPVNPGIVTLSMDIYIAMTGSVGQLFLAAFDTSGGSMAELSLAGTTASLSTSAGVNAGGSVARGQWSNLALALDQDAGIANIYVDGILGGTQAYSATSPVGIISILMFPQGSATAEYYIDNVALQEGSPASTVPEPSTMVLVGAGMVAAGLRRRLRAR